MEYPLDKLTSQCLTRCFHVAEPALRQQRSWRHCSLPAGTVTPPLTSRHTPNQLTISTNFRNTSQHPFSPPDQPTFSSSHSVSGRGSGHSNTPASPPLPQKDNNEGEEGDDEQEALEMRKAAFMAVLHAKKPLSELSVTNNNGRMGTVSSSSTGGGGAGLVLSAFPFR